MTRLRQQMLEEMQLRGLSAGTQESYIGTVKRLAAHYQKPPDEISDGPAIAHANIRGARYFH